MQGRSTCLWRYTPGIASEFIHHLPDLLANGARPVVVYCRVSTLSQKLKGNLDDQVTEAIQMLGALGISRGPNLLVVAHVGASSINANRFDLERAIESARRRNGIVVAVHRDRFIRSSIFDGRRETELPRIAEYMRLKHMADNVPLATLYDPDQPARSNQIKRGQKAKGNRGGRPRKRAWKKRRLRRINLAREWRNDGKSYQQIADLLNARDDGFTNQTPMTVYNWLKKGI